MLRMEARYTGKWSAAVGALNWLERKSLSAVKRAERREANYLRGLMKKNIRSGGSPPFAPIKPFTEAIRRATGRRGAKPLLASRNLLKLIKTHKVGNGDWFVGIRRGEVYRDHRGITRDAVTLALMLENGRKPIVLDLDKPSSETGKTPRQWLWWLYLTGAMDAPPSPAKTHMVIGAAPQRPFVRNLYMQEKEKIRQRIIDRFAQEFWTVRLPSGISGSGTIRQPPYNLSF